jgi:hypothetical protein
MWRFFGSINRVHWFGVIQPVPRIRRFSKNIGRLSDVSNNGISFPQNIGCCATSPFAGQEVQFYKVQQVTVRSISDDMELRHTPSSGYRTVLYNMLHDPSLSFIQLGLYGLCYC